MQHLYKDFDEWFKNIAPYLFDDLEEIRSSNDMLKRYLMIAFGDGRRPAAYIENKND